MDIDGTVKTIKVKSQDFFNKLCPAKNPVGFTDKCAEELELHWRKFRALVSR